jgi:hypothetical protein
VPRWTGARSWSQIAAGGRLWPQSTPTGCDLAPDPSIGQLWTVGSAETIRTIGLGSKAHLRSGAVSVPACRPLTESPWLVSRPGLGSQRTADQPCPGPCRSSSGVRQWPRSARNFFDSTASDARVSRRPCRPGHRFRSVELSPRAAGAVEEQLRRILATHVQAPPFLRLDPAPTALETEKSGRDCAFGALGHGFLDRSARSMQGAVRRVHALWIPWKVWTTRRTPS